MIDLLNKRILYRHVGAGKHDVAEGRVDEYSPSGKYFRIGSVWRLIKDYRFVEELDGKEERRP